MEVLVTTGRNPDKQAIRETSCQGGQLSMSVYTRSLASYVETHYVVLVVNDCGIKVIGNIHANHLKQTLDKFYNVVADWIGSLFYESNLKWN